MVLAGVILISGGAMADSVTQLTSPAQLSGGDTTLIYSGTIGSTPASPVTFTAGANTLTFSDTGGIFELDQAANNYFGTSFADNTIILFAAGFSGPGGPVTLTFSQPVTEFGVNIEEFAAGPYTVTFTAFDGATPLGTFMASGCDPASGTCPTPNGALSFEGLQTTGSLKITSVVFTDNNTPNDDLGLGPVTFGGPSSQVPEPSSLSLLALAFAGMALFTAFRRLP